MHIQVFLTCVYSSYVLPIYVSLFAGSSRKGARRKRASYHESSSDEDRVVDSEEEQRPPRNAVSKRPVSAVDKGKTVWKSLKDLSSNDYALFRKKN